MLASLIYNVGSVMGKIDWFFAHEADYFEGRLQKLVIEIHRFATEQLEVVYKQEFNTAAQEGQLEDHQLFSYQDYLEGEQAAQQRALATMARLSRK